MFLGANATTGHWGKEKKETYIKKKKGSLLDIII